MEERLCECYHVWRKNMKINVKTLKETHFEIQVNPKDMVLDVKKIEIVQGVEGYPAVQKMLIHHGKVLKDESIMQSWSQMRATTAQRSLFQGILKQMKIHLTT
ncbi:hypothetical protein KIW84_022356 [Lathyrus oleraceus]|uniref:Ubiquitin-like domain-containing protein n=1 Tax=Pisum sativum TaxID=3888 RepID=A0A9D4YAD5_PEA|nr:hypothetical protein KIW84_022356 [Pisum sativum]